MKFAVGDKVTIKNRAGSFWNDVKAEVTSVDPKEDQYPYGVILLEDTTLESFKKGGVVEAWKESELVLTSDMVAVDIEQAKALLQKHGLAFRIYSREDVDKMLDAYGEDENEPLDTKTFRAELVEFIMGGKDWADLSRKGFDDESTLWNLVEGARNDHPEWFVS